jgi:hypothetical protein
MTTPFDRVIDDVIARKYHNHRLQEHSDMVGEGIFTDLQAMCPALRRDVEEGIVKHWLNVPTPGARNRKIDLLIGEPLASDPRKPNIELIRVCVENKSVITAHRNRDARFDDLNDTLLVLHDKRPEAVKVATVMIGTAQRVLNVPDRIKPFFVGNEVAFEQKIVPKLSSGDQALWTQFPGAISKNRPDDPASTISKFRQLSTRPIGHTHVNGYDYLLLVPVFIDNVNKPYLARDNGLGIDIDKSYTEMLDRICRAYQGRWPHEQ